MRLPVMREYLLDFRVKFDPVFPACLFHHMPSAERLDGPLEQLICLESDDKFVLLVYISSRVGSDCRDGLRIDCADPAVGPFFSQGIRADCPEFSGAVGRSLEE